MGFNHRYIFMVLTEAIGIIDIVHFLFCDRHGIAGVNYKEVPRHDYDKSRQQTHNEKPNNPLSDQLQL